MKRFLASLTSMAAISISIVGCGDSALPNAHPITAPEPRAAAPDHNLTKEEKIDRINKAPIPEPQKKDAIAKVNAGQL